MKRSQALMVFVLLLAAAAFTAWRLTTQQAPLPRMNLAGNGPQGVPADALADAPEVSPAEPLASRREAVEHSAVQEHPAIPPVVPVPREPFQVLDAQGQPVQDGWLRLYTRQGRELAMRWLRLDSEPAFTIQGLTDTEWDAIAWWCVEWAGHRTQAGRFLSPKIQLAEEVGLTARVVGHVPPGPVTLTAAWVAEESEADEPPLPRQIHGLLKMRVEMELAHGEAVHLGQMVAGERLRYSVPFWWQLASPDGPSRVVLDRVTQREQTLQLMPTPGTWYALQWKPDRLAHRRVHPPEPRYADWGAPTFRLVVDGEGPESVSGGDETAEPVPRSEVRGVVVLSAMASGQRPFAERRETMREGNLIWVPDQFSGEPVLDVRIAGDFIARVVAPPVPPAEGVAAPKIFRWRPQLEEEQRRLGENSQWTRKPR